MIDLLISKEYKVFIGRILTAMVLRQNLNV